MEDVISLNLVWYKPSDAANAEATLHPYSFLSSSCFLVARPLFKACIFVEIDIWFFSSRQRPAFFVILLCFPSSSILVFCCAMTVLDESGAAMVTYRRMEGCVVPGHLRAQTVVCNLSPLARVHKPRAQGWKLHHDISGYLVPFTRIHLEKSPCTR